jgi:hypothetical protein
MNRLVEEIRRSSDGEVAAILATDDGHWLFEECRRRLPSDVLMRIAHVITAVLPPGTLEGILSGGSTTPARESGHG